VWSWIILEKLTVAQSLKNPDILWNRLFITLFKRARNWLVSWTRLNQLTVSHSICLIFFLIISSYLSLYLPSSLSHSDFPTKTLYVILVSPVRAIGTWLAHPTFLWFIILIIFGAEYRLWSSPVCNFLQPCITAYRSQWPCKLRTSQILWSWVRISFEACLSVCFCSVCR
jgi:hypothetical protein